ncbi:MAG: cytidylate kinase family protein [Candidatus Hydrogenedentes bacterium]|nr:cytidylate kinase family protein [Candidatus Hydrogenedentota bacterium]
MGKEIVTITGSLGSGKSVVGKAVAALLGVPYFSTGDLQRALAARKGMTTLELNRLAETDPSIDYEIDGLMQEFAGKNDRCVIDSRLAWHFVPYSFKCYLQVDEKVGIERILGDTRRKSEKYASLDEAYQAVKGRKASEEKRFAALYDLDLSNMENYDLVVDTSVARPEAIAGKVVECFRKWRAGEDYQKYWASHL